MNPSYLGDSYDLVKRFFCHELSHLGYLVSADPMLTGAWNSDEQDFYRLIGAQPFKQTLPGASRTALFIDPDTGINARGSEKHASYKRLAQESTRYRLVFAFDQSFSRLSKPKEVMLGKLAELNSLGCHGMYYDSHARFLFVAQECNVLQELMTHLLSLGLPSSRLITSERLG
jgi:hypothetical protein